MIFGLIVAVAIGGNAEIVAIVADVSIAVVIEAMIIYNIIPSVRRLRPLFKYLPLDLRILAEGAKVIYRTEAAGKLDKTTLAAIAARIPPAKSKEIVSFRLDTPEGEIVKVFRLQSGAAVLVEQSDEIRQLRSRQDRQHDKLVRQVALLERKRDMQSILYRQQREQELYVRVESDLKATTTQIQQILDELEEHADSLTDEERLERLNLVKVLTAYCKRKGMLILASTESETITRAQITTVSREAMDDLRSVGIECAVLVAVEDEIPIAAFNLAYDTFYDCIVGVLYRAHPVVMVYICQNDDDSLEVRISIECAIGLDSETAVERIPRLASSTEPLTATLEDIVDDLDTRLVKRGLAYTIGLADNLVSIVVRIGGGRI